MIDQLVRGRWRPLLLVGLGLAIAACTPPADPGSLPSVAPTQPAGPATEAADPAATSMPAASPATETASGGLRLVLVPAESEARFRAREQLAGQSLPSEAIGRTSELRGSILLRSDGSIAAEQSRITVDLASLRSDQDRRDNFIKRNTLQTDRFPIAVFVAKSASGLPSPLPTAGEVMFQLAGDLIIRDVSRPVTWQITAQFTPDGVKGQGTTTVRLEDFGMTRPTVGPVLSIEENIVLEIDFLAERSS